MSQDPEIKQILKTQNQIEDQLRSQPSNSISLHESEERKSEDRSSELASIGGCSNHHSLLQDSPKFNENSEPVIYEELSTMLVESNAQNLAHRSERKNRESVVSEYRRAKHEKRQSKKKAKQNKVEFKYGVRIAKMEKQTGFGTWISSFFTKEDDPVRALASVEHVPEQKGVPKNEFQVTVQAGQTANIQFKVFNRTQNDWDKGCYLINDFEGGLHETFFEIRKVIQSNHMFYLEIQIYIP